jgi:hypothetical protein
LEEVNDVSESFKDFYLYRRGADLKNRMYYSDDVVVVRLQKMYLEKYGMKLSKSEAVFFTCWRELRQERLQAKRNLTDRDQLSMFREEI